MTGFILSPAAQADVDDIWNYTAERWGQAQAERYILAIREACRELATGRRISRTSDEIRPGYRKTAVGSHILFFKQDEGTPLNIIRILHQSMDVNRHLN